MAKKPFKAVTNKGSGIKKIDEVYKAHDKGLDAEEVLGKAAKGKNYSKFK